jgi:hypothetical protein
VRSRVSDTKCGTYEFASAWFVARRSIQLSYGRTVHRLLSIVYRRLFFVRHSARQSNVKTVLLIRLELMGWLTQNISSKSPEAETLEDGCEGRPASAWPGQDLSALASSNGRWFSNSPSEREAIAAMDFFTVPTMVLYCFFIEVIAAVKATRIIPKRTPFRSLAEWHRGALGGKLQTPPGPHGCTE